MSAQHKVKKYITKLEKTQSPKKFDIYAAKLKKYKMVQSGGAAWDQAVTEASDKLKQIGDVPQTVFDKIAEIGTFDRGNTAELESALKSLNTLITEIQNKSNGATELLKDLNTKLEEIKTKGQTVETGETIWNRIIGKREETKAPDTPATPVPAPPTQPEEGSTQP